MTENETLQQMTRDEAINKLITPGGKQLGIYHVKNTSLYKATFQSGGEVPKELSGMYTDTNRAYEAAKKYVSRRWDEDSRKVEGRGPGRPKKEDNEKSESASK